MSYYSEKYKVYGFNCNKDLEMRVESLFQFMIETSVKQTEKLMIDNMDYEDYFWVIYQWDVEIIKRPKYNDEIIVDTISVGANKFYAYRNFTIFDEEGNIFVKAKTKWLLLNKNRKMPVRIPMELMELYGSDESLRRIEKEFKIDDDITFNKGEGFSVKKSDIDSNNHVNNAKYLNWILETVDNDREIKRIELIYKKETKYGEKIISQSTNIKKEINKNIVYNKIIDENGNIKTLSKIYLGE